MTATTYVLKLAVDGVPEDELKAGSLELVGFQLRTATRRLAAREEDDAPVWDWIEAGHQHALDQLAEGHSVTVEFQLQTTAQRITWQLHPVLPGFVATDPKTGEPETLPAIPTSPAATIERAWTRPVPRRIVDQVHHGLSGADATRAALEKEEDDDADSGDYDVNMRPAFTTTGDTLADVFLRAASWAAHDPTMRVHAIAYEHQVDQVDGDESHRLEVIFSYPGD